MIADLSTTEKIAPLTSLLASPKPERKWKKWLKGILVLGLAFGLYQLGQIFIGLNLNTVLPGKIYRGAQPNAPTIHWLVQKHGIKTVLNLRGNCYPETWFLNETQAIHDLGINFETLTMTAGRLPSKRELRRLIELLEEVEYPLYIHCRRGSDRTGLVSAFALMLLTDVPYPQARKQLGILYGHFEIGITAHMDQFFHFYEDWLIRKKKEHTAVIFRHWVLNEYEGGFANYSWEEITPLTPTFKVGKPICYQVRVKNISPYPWKTKKHLAGGIHLGYELLSEDDRMLDIGRAGLQDGIIEPGEIWEVKLVVPPQKSAGRFRLRMDLVEVGHLSFYHAGANFFEKEIGVEE